MIEFILKVLFWYVIGLIIILIYQIIFKGLTFRGTRKMEEYKKEAREFSRQRLKHD